MRSQSELNWVFILVAGAIILVFFTGFAFKYKDLQEQKTAIEILTTLDNTLTSFKSSPYKTFDEINLPIKLEITCNEIKVNNENFKTNNLLFSQARLKNKMFIYYVPFKAPFKISDFYLISDLNRKFHLVHDSSTQSYIIELINNLPQELQRKFTYSTLQKNEANVKNVQIKSLNNNKISIDNQEIYLNDDLVYAAIFSDNFNCMQEKINKEINNAVNVYKNKALTLNKPNCNYNAFLTYLDKIKENDFTYVNSIETLNEDLTNDNCPTLY